MDLFLREISINYLIVMFICMFQHALEEKSIYPTLSYSDDPLTFVLELLWNFGDYLIFLSPHHQVQLFNPVSKKLHSSIVTINIFL